MSKEELKKIQTDIQWAYDNLVEILDKYWLTNSYEVRIVEI